MAEERQAATETIHEWNAQHASNESVVLLPVKWETHAMPQSGIRPQEAINRQLVRESDILVGMFWTKIGTSTGVAESGTVEEIDQFVANAKPALLYFSSRPIDPGKIDLEQHKRLREFQQNTYQNALVGTFSDLHELQHKLLRDLMRQVHALKAAQSVEQKNASDNPAAASRASEINKRVIALAIQSALSTIEYWRGQNVANLAAIHQLPSTLDLVPAHSSTAELEAGRISQEASAELNNAFESLKRAQQQLEIMRDAKMTSPQLYQQRTQSFSQCLADAELEIQSAQAHLQQENRSD